MSSSPYSAAAQMLTQIWTQRKSLKTLAYDKKGTLRCTKATYAQVCHVLEAKTILTRVLERLGGFTNVRNEGLLYILLYELLMGPNKKIRGGGALKRQLTAKEADLRRILADFLEADPQAATVSESFPRYLRINTLQTNLSDVVSALQPLYKEIYADKHVPNVLVLPPSTPLHENKLVRTGKVVLQDKSSCFSALCLIQGNSKPLEGDYLDACAAPGNKTSHLAALVAEQKGKGRHTVYAMDRSSTRMTSLQRRMEQLVPSEHPRVRVVTQHTDFLQSDPSDATYKSLRGILLDPSCSGSGIFTSPDRSMEVNDDEGDLDGSRIQSLSNFQFVALKHAMSFPQVERIVYSTCSIHEQENENVVRQALEANPEWQVVAPQCLHHWPRRGHVVEGLTEAQAQCLIRADRGDETNGFFVSYFERKASLESEHKSKAPPSLAAPIKGVPIYNGEFAKNDSKQDSAIVTLAKPSNSKKVIPVQAREPKQDRATEKAVPTKRAKKVAWKRRQMEEKVRRIEKKKVDTTTSTANN